MAVTTVMEIIISFHLFPNLSNLYSISSPLTAHCDEEFNTFILPPLPSLPLDFAAIIIIIIIFILVIMIIIVIMSCNIYKLGAFLAYFLSC